MALRTLKAGWKASAHARLRGGSFVSSFSNHETSVGLALLTGVPPSPHPPGGESLPRAAPPREGGREEGPTSAHSRDGATAAGRGPEARPRGGRCGQEEEPRGQRDKPNRREAEDANPGTERLHQLSSFFLSFFRFYLFI